MKGGNELQESTRRSRRRRAFGAPGVASALCALVAYLATPLASATNGFRYMVSRIPANMCLSVSVAGA
jgi:hypothetical protein